MYLLFVYGTLKTGEEGHDEISDIVFLGKTKTQPKYQIVKLNDLSGIKNGDESVYGELYVVTSEKLNQLDNYEYKLYDRRLIDLASGRKAFAYFLKD
jgi:gamma-glutamylcyclotransferase (GGCT)/AIG2-like uncharacterized protein YtfP